MGPDDLDKMIAERGERDPEFPQLVHAALRRRELDRACEVFRTSLRAGEPVDCEIAPLADDQAARLAAFRDAVRDAVDGAAHRDGEGFEAAFAQTRHIASRIDTRAVIDSLHIPEDAGEHEDALRRLLLRIPDGWGRWISCSSGWFALLSTAEHELAAVCPTFTVQQIKEKFGTLRLYVEFDIDDDLPTDIRAAEPRCPTCKQLAEILGREDIEDLWQEAYAAVIEPAHGEWARQVEAIRESEAGRRAIEDQTGRAAAFQALVDRFEKESATTCELCGASGVLSCSDARSPWYAVRCESCRPDGWIVASDSD